jgi:hypothetical protein
MSAELFNSTPKESNSPQPYVIETQHLQYLRWPVFPRRYRPVHPAEAVAGAPRNCDAATGGGGCAGGRVVTAQNVPGPWGL